MLIYEEALARCMFLSRHQSAEGWCTYCLYYWLGLKIYDSLSCSIFERVSDPFGDHQVGCGGNGDRIYRHNSVRETAQSAAALAPQKEAPSLFPGSVSRPAHIFLPH